MWPHRFVAADIISAVNLFGTLKLKTTLSGGGARGAVCRMGGAGGGWPPGTVEPGAGAQYPHYSRQQPPSVWAYSDSGISSAVLQWRLISLIVAAALLSSELSFYCAHSNTIWVKLPPYREAIIAGQPWDQTRAVPNLKDKTAEK